jgi:hypothetical protein
MYCMTSTIHRNLKRAHRTLYLDKNNFVCLFCDLNLLTSPELLSLVINSFGMEKVAAYHREKSDGLVDILKAYGNGIKR